MKKETTVVELFEKKVTAELMQCGFAIPTAAENHFAVGVAVSGGADSISLVTALRHILPQEIPLQVITVNHNLRPQEETDGDASYVELYCRSIMVPCTRIEIPRGKIIELASTQEMSVEEAARFLRYESFASFCKEKKISFFCIAHNKNDQVETVFMRFLRGSSVLAGIPETRALCEGTRILRPLISTTRKEIEQYLAAQNIQFRTDKTNFDPAMFRNFIRTKVAPVIENEIPGWQNAVCLLAEKARDDDEALRALTEQSLGQIDFTQKNKSHGTENEAIEISFDCGKFARLMMAVRRRVVYVALEKLGVKGRVPYSFVKEICRRSEIAPARVETFSAAGVTATVDRARVFLQKKVKDATESGFFVIMKQVGISVAGPWVFCAKENSDKGGIVLQAVHSDSYEENEEFFSESAIEIPGIKFPFAIRSRQPGDEIKTAGGSMKSIASILENNHVGTERDCIPLIQELQSSTQQIVCIWGSVLGYSDWIVKE